jgi:fatty acid desaturase
MERDIVRFLSSRRQKSPTQISSLALRLNMLVRSSVILLAISSSAVAFHVGGRRSQLSQLKPETGLQQKAVAVALDVPVSVLEEDTKHSLDPEDAWVANLDYDAFSKDVTALGKALLKETGDADVDHLYKIVNWRNIAALVGLSTIWLPANPLTVAALSTWTYSSWTMIAHHTCHGGYNRMDAGRFNSRGFGLGPLNRCVDWLDWMQPEAWNIEHNRLHHYRLNESKDPDLVQRNLDFVRDANYPRFLKYVVVAFFLPIWKWFYYAPNTYKELKVNEWVKSGKELPKDFDPENAVTVVSMLDPRSPSTREIVKPMDFYMNVVGPMFFGRYVAIPALLALIPGVGPTIAVHALANLVLAELLTNVHAFATIVTNHAGDDMYTFDDAVKPKTGSFYVRQIVGSVNYDAGTDPIDFWHGWLNYQIEHHVWPDLSMLQYQRAAPRLKAICEKHGIPYVQENVFERTRKTIEIMVGKTTMRKFPTQYEPAKDKAGAAGITWKSTNGAIDDDIA